MRREEAADNNVSFFSKLELTLVNTEERKVCYYHYNPKVYSSATSMACGTLLCPHLLPLETTYDLWKTMFAVVYSFS